MKTGFYDVDAQAIVAAYQAKLKTGFWFVTAATEMDRTSADVIQVRAQMEWIYTVQPTMLNWRLGAGELFKDTSDFKDNGTVKAQNKSPVTSTDNEFSPGARYDSSNSQQTAIMPGRHLIGTIIFLFVVLSLRRVWLRHCSFH